QIDDIKVEYHKSSRRPTHIYSFENFKRNERTVDLDLLTPEPWKPFKTRLDFEVAEVIHEAKLNSKLTDRLLKAVHKILQKPCDFTLDSSADLNQITIPYKGQPKTFEFHSRPLWDWILSQVRDPLLAPHFEWDAQRLSKFDGTKWVRFYDEPWTASKFAEVQSHISSVRPDGKPLAIILWADTSVLSTFGTQKGHYIVARIGNLPQSIRNGNSVGGGRVVGFVPIVGANAAEQGKPSFVNWKNTVFHEAFRAFLKIVARLSKVGQVVHCGDRISRVLFPYIHILSADYEEQCRFALIRGLGGNAPCPVCLVPKGTLSDLRTRYAYRVAAEVQELVHKVESKKAKEAALKPLGLRAVKNALWDVENSDVHEATSFDRLHAYIIGLFQKHLLPEIKTLLEDMGRWAETTCTQPPSRFQNMERWPNLSHFTHGLFKMDFSDGKKWEHASKILLHVAYNIFNQERSLKGFALLRLFRSWQELNTYLTFEVQTSVTISAFERTLLRFHDRLAEMDGVIKIHSHLHAARDIRRKGVIANMDTKVNEKMNRPMRETYHRQTNFKNVEPQLGKFDDRDQAAVSIRAHLDALDKQENLVHTGLPKEPKSIEWQFAQVYLGSRQKPTDFKDFAAQAAHDDAFIRFRQKLTDCLTDLIPRENPRGNQLLLNRRARNTPTIHNSDKASFIVTECEYLKVDYESTVSWRTATDRLYCRPSRPGRTERCDCVMVQMSANDVTFARLVRLFVYFSEGNRYALALVHPFTADRAARDGDAELGLCRIRVQPRRSSMIIPVRSIIRGVLVVADNENDEEYTIMDTLDQDIFLRLMPLFPNRDMEII
ncbi:hypothetical protein BC835DRAFT_1288244, partial [Cytidiella melzeri]